MRASVQLNQISFDMNTKCQGVIFAQDTLQGETVILEHVDKIEVVLKSNSVRDKVLYSLNRDEFIQLQNGLIWKNQISENSGLYIPFAIGNLNLTDDDVIEVEVKFKDGVYSDGDVMDYSKVLVKDSASNPLTVKKIQNKDEFDSAYYNCAIVKTPVGFDYVSESNEKIYIPKLFVGMARTNGVTAINLENNKTYSLSEMSNLLLVDY